jgi:hypothetical protein
MIAEVLLPKAGTEMHGKQPGELYDEDKAGTQT